MEILINLFITFFKIGLFTIGGGYAMIPMIKTEAIDKGWITMDELTNFLAISESTPGPFAINIATFIGESQAGILGALFATIGVIAPSIIIILIIFRINAKFLKNEKISGFLNGIKAVVIGLIIATALKLVFDELFKAEVNLANIDYKSIIIMGISASLFFVKVKKKTISPIIVIIVSAVLGIILYGLF